MDMKEKIAELKTLRDQVRLKAHLANMEARPSLMKLDEELDRLEARLERAEEKSRVAVANALERLAKSFMKANAKLEERQAGKAQRSSQA
jgi:hypothetical protein